MIRGLVLINGNENVQFCGWLQVLYSPRKGNDEVCYCRVPNTDLYSRNFDSYTALKEALVSGVDVR